MQQRTAWLGRFGYWRSDAGTGGIAAEGGCPDGDDLHHLPAIAAKGGGTGRELEVDEGARLGRREAVTDAGASPIAAPVQAVVEVNDGQRG
ncbi:MAG: hypothetical protein EXQ93_00510 [Alphaproteobacteria bacterium]|nr:hypothetical protein [Alphaproteobacteria bacterium]